MYLALKSKPISPCAIFPVPDSALVATSPNIRFLLFIFVSDWVLHDRTLFLWDRIASLKPCVNPVDYVKCENNDQRYCAWPVPLLYDMYDMYDITALLDLNCLASVILPGTDNHNQDNLSQCPNVNGSTGPRGWIGMQSPRAPRSCRWTLQRWICSPLLILGRLTPTIQTGRGHRNRRSLPYGPFLPIFKLWQTDVRARRSLARGIGFGD